jgi:hypothetical protein
MQGLGLLRILIEATGLPAAAVERELTKILASRNLTAETISIDDVREVLSSYLQEVLTQAKDSVNETPPTNP